MRLPKTSIFHGNCLEVLKTIEDETYTGIVSDPPYGLSFMGKKWDYDVPSIEVFEQLLRVTKKGGFIFCFGGSRTFHRMACNMEDAGWILRDTIMWVYGSGFPKSLDISKGIDKKLGKKVHNQGYIPNKKNNVFGKTFGGGEKTTNYNPQTEESKLWDGYGTGLKPSFEPIIVAMKPMDNGFVDNALDVGVSGMNLSECRVGNEEVLISTWDKGASFFDPVGTTNKQEYTNRISIGRWPANFIHDGSDEVEECFPTTSPSSKGGTRGSKDSFFARFNTRNYPRNGYEDSGSASRFFYCAKPSSSEKQKGCDELEIKQSKGGGGMNDAHLGRAYGSLKAPSKNHHPTVKPINLMRYIVRLSKMPKDTKLLDPYMGSGTTVVASILEGIDCDGIERENDYVLIAQKRIKQARKDYLNKKGERK